MQFTILVTHDFLEMLCKSLSDVIMDLHVGDPSESHLLRFFLLFYSSSLQNTRHSLKKAYVRGANKGYE